MLIDILYNGASPANRILLRMYLLVVASVRRLARDVGRRVDWRQRRFEEKVTLVSSERP